MGSGLGEWGRRWLAEVGGFFFPRVCLVCEKGLPVQGKEYLCFNCRAELAYTDFHTLPENPVTDRLAGRIPLVFGGAFFYYRPKGRAQRVIHALKYYNRPEIGNDLGQAYGKILREVAVLKDLDYVVPVPIHAARRHERGYNQAEAIGRGVVRELEAELLPNGLIRRRFEASQTKKGRSERARNVAAVFAVGKTDLEGKHVLLIDDVLTTGATLEACADVVLAAYPGARVSVAVLGITE